MDNSCGQHGGKLEKYLFRFLTIANTRQGGARLMCALHWKVRSAPFSSYTVWGVGLLMVMERIEWREWHRVCGPSFPASPLSLLWSCQHLVGVTPSIQFFPSPKEAAFEYWDPSTNENKCFLTNAFRYHKTATHRWHTHHSRMYTSSSSTPRTGWITSLWRGATPTIAEDESTHLMIFTLPLWSGTPTCSIMSTTR